MNSQLSYAVARSQQQDLIRRAEHVRLATEVRERRGSWRVRLTAPRPRFARRVTTATTTTANA
jgi:hypothetical protein